MRGKRVPDINELSHMRNIPAYAGKTPGRGLNHNQSAEHPRVCGENHQQAHTDLTYAGTSPRMRGKLVRLPCQLSAMRNIPAYAGKTCCWH